jgi:hypothetical protein
MKDRTHDKTQKVSKKETESIFPFMRCEEQITDALPLSCNQDHHEDYPDLRLSIVHIPIISENTLFHFSLNAISSILLSKSAIQEQPHPMINHSHSNFT